MNIRLDDEIDATAAKSKILLVAAPKITPIPDLAL